MRAVTATSSLISVHAPSVPETPMSAPSRHRVLTRLSDSVFVIVPSSSRGSVNDETEIALIAADRFGATGNAVDSVDLGEQCRLGIRCGRKSVIRARQLFLRHGANDIGRHDDHQLSLVVDEVLAPEQLAEQRQLIDTGQSVDGLLGLLLNETGHRQRSAGWN